MFELAGILLTLHVLRPEGHERLEYLEKVL